MSRAGWGENYRGHCRIVIDRVALLVCNHSVCFAAGPVTTADVCVALACVGGPVACGATGFNLLRAVAVMAAAVFGLCAPAFAQAPASNQSTVAKSETKPDAPPSGEIWTGGEGFRSVLSLYGGATWAPNGTLAQDGLRLRVSGGMSRYHTTTEKPCPNVVPVAACSYDVPVSRMFAQAMIGWQQQWGATTVKTFAGVAYADERLSSAISNRYLKGARIGPSVALEVWHTFSPSLWASLDLAFAAPDREHSARGRIGVRFGEALSAGPEIAYAARSNAHLRAADGTMADAKTGTLQKYGAFVRWDNGAAEVSVSGGAVRPSQGSTGVYLSGQYLSRF